MSRSLLQRHGTISFLAHARGIFKMAWYGKVHFIQRAVIAFLVVEKESVTNIHKRLTDLYVANAVDKSTVSRWTSRMAGFEKGQAVLSDARRCDRPTAVLTQGCFNVLINSFETTDG